MALALVALGVWGRDGAVPECKPVGDLELSAVGAAADADADAVGGSDELSAQVAETERLIASN